MKTLLYRPDGVNIDTLSNGLGISRNATYQHVKTLERDGLIAGHRIKKTKGRPGQTYRLTRKGHATFKQSYSMIASLLVGAVKSKLGNKETATLLQHIGETLALDSVDELSALPPNRRIHKISEIMASLGYETMLEFDEDNDLEMPLITAYNCVFHDVAKEHSEVCEMDLTLLRNLSGYNIEHRECIIKGGNVCRFAFKKNN